MADLYYIDSGYFTPDTGYFVYTADAASAQTVTATMTVAIGRVQTATASLAATVTQTALCGRKISSVIDCGSLFSVGLTVIVYRNHTAALAVTATVSATPVANKATAITLSTLANLNSQAQKTAVITSTQSVTATQTATAQRTRNLSSTQSADTTLSATALNVQQAQAAFTVDSTLRTNRYAGGGRPFNIVNGTYSFDTTVKKFGTASLQNATNANSAVSGVSYANTQTPKMSESYVAEFWYYNTSHTDPGSTAGFGVGTAPIAANFWLRPTANGVLQFYQTYTDGASYSQSNSASNVIQLNSWNHILVVADPAASGNPPGSYQIAIFVNGTRRIQAYRYSDNDFYQNNYNRYDFFKVTGLGANSRLDEVSLHIGTTLGYSTSSSTITVPTTARLNDPTYTRFMYHFNSDALDDISVIQSVSASLTTNSTQTATATKTVSGASIQTATVTQTVTAAKAVFGAASLAVTASIEAKVKKYAGEEAALVTATFSQTAIANRIRSGASDLATTASLTADVNRVKSFTIDCGALFASAITAIGYKNHDAHLTTTATMTVQSVATRSAVSSQSAVFSQTATVKRTRTVTSTQSAVFSQTTVATKQQFVSASLSTVASITAFPYYTRGIVSRQSAVFTETVTARTTLNLASSQTATFTETVTASRIRGIVSSQSATFTETATVKRTRGFVSDQSATFSQSTQAIKTARTASTQTVLSALSSQAQKTARIVALLPATATELSLPYINAAGTIVLNTASTMTTAPGTIKQYQPNRIWGVRAVDTSTYPKFTIASAPLGAGSGWSGWVVSVWARRTESTGDIQPIWSTQENAGTIAWRGNNIIMRSSGGSTSSAPATWNNANTFDANWHHFLILTIPDQSGGNYQHRLWVDGVDRGLAQSTFNGSFGITTGNDIRLGYARTPALSAPYSLTDYALAGDIAQFWMGEVNHYGQTYNPENNLTVGDFYDGGPVDLVSLPPPSKYTVWASNILSKPYTGVTTATSATQSLPLPEFSARFTIAPAPSAVILNAPTAIAAAFTLRAQPQDRTKTGSASLSVTSTQSLSVISRTRSAQAAASATVSQTAIIGQRKQFASAQSAVFVLTTSVTVILPKQGSANITATSTLAATITRRRPGISIEGVNATLSCDATVIPPKRTSAALTVTVTQTATAYKIHRTGSVMAVQAYTTAQVRKTARPNAALATTATLTLTAIKKTGAVAHFQVVGSELVVITVINLVPELIYLVPQESRWWRVLPENRQIMVDEETRVNTIRG